MDAFEQAVYLQNLIFDTPKDAFEWPTADNPLPFRAAAFQLRKRRPWWHIISPNRQPIVVDEPNDEEYEAIFEEFIKIPDSDDEEVGHAEVVPEEVEGPVEVQQDVAMEEDADEQVDVHAVDEPAMEEDHGDERVDDPRVEDQPMDDAAADQADEVVIEDDVANEEVEVDEEDEPPMEADHGDEQINDGRVEQDHPNEEVNLQDEIDQDHAMDDGPVEQAHQILIEDEVELPMEEAPLDNDAENPEIDGTSPQIADAPLPTSSQLSSLPPSSALSSLPPSSPRPTVAPQPAAPQAPVAAPPTIAPQPPVAAPQVLVQAQQGPRPIQSDAVPPRIPAKYTIHSAADDAKFINNLKTMWIQQGLDRNQVNRITIPTGYRLLGSRRQGGRFAGRVDWDLIGHPRGRTFESYRKFFPHLVYLIGLTDGTTAPGTCQCMWC